MSVKAIIFDYGKVISFPPEDKVARELASIARVSREELEGLRWKYRADYDRGDIDGPLYYRRLLEKLGKESDAERDQKLSQIDRDGWTNINPGTVKLMEEIKKAGYILGILSNMPFDFLEYARKNIPVFGLPHTAVYSCEARCVKPEPEIYQKTIAAVERLLPRCRPEELVFFDDIPENVESARNAKINAFVWENPAAARRQLAALGVNL